MIRHLRFGALAAVAAVAAPLFTTQAAELRMIGGFPENFVFTTEIAHPFMKRVEEESGGALTVSLQGPDAVPTFEQFEPVQAGVFDLLFTHPAYHAGVSALGLSIDAIDPDPAKRRDAGVIAFIDDHYRQHNLKLIAAPATGSEGFRYFMKAPIEGTPAMQGLKIRGTVSYHPMIEALGGTPVVMSGGEVYSALQKGVIDGAAWGLTGAKDFKWYEVADYMADPTFGQVGVMIFMNLESWEALSAEEQAMLTRVGREIETASVERFDLLAKEETAALLDLGMKMTAFAPEEAERFDALWADGVWSVSTAKSDAATELRALAQEAGLTP
ncbi:MAG: TRAP transporter substrate-binding protein DctP [Marivibrio sp.]|uniref:TRAP transporter substrate-binding protein DctP n=1 Tax=Marivibrio sp. TaxID=2039719 RepID=UPI0032ED7E71